MKEEHVQNILGEICIQFLPTNFWENNNSHNFIQIKSLSWTRQLCIKVKTFSHNFTPVVTLGH